MFDKHRHMILLTGATGYVGGRLLKVLEGNHKSRSRQNLESTSDRPQAGAGYRVRCLARRPAYLEKRVAPGTEVVQGDVLEAESLDEALKGIHTAFYLIHSMGDSKHFEEIERRGAENFAGAARKCGVQRIIYLGGLGDEEMNLSAHLRSRHAVGEILRSSGIETIEFRASIIIGSGSLSFEMVRDLVEKLPVMTTPRWVSVKAQPIGVQDLLQYLQQAIHLRPAESRVFEIGGADRVTYGELMKEYARQRGLRRYMIPVPVLTPRLSSLWLALVTPLYARVGRKLIDSIRHPTVVRDDSALEVFSVRPRGLSRTIADALEDEDREFAATRWSDANSAGGGQSYWGGIRFGKRLVDSRTVDVCVPPATAFGPIRRIGGRNGWYYCNWLWRVRGFIDLLAGGIGIRRGRHSPENLEVGEPLDWWRIEAYEADRLLRLSAEMKVPGRAWLQFEVTGEAGGSKIRQTAIFDPFGLSGLVYWYGIYPIHALIFRGMLREIARRAEAHKPQPEGKPRSQASPEASS
ncbi:MAG TPA: SDR family oxidoreductase [Acidobacteriota bacterium]|nr:SDR family oxidoreductase [Acidobacteriota bacterium]